MTYNRLERRLAALLDALPGLKRTAKSGYQRLNYALHGGHRADSRLAAGTALDRVPAPDSGAATDECFFGYFGTSPWSRDGRKLLFHRWAGHGDSADICVHDAATGASRAIARTVAWNFQQGSMAQWLPSGGSDSVVFNDRVDDAPGCRILEPGGDSRSLPWPIQALHPQAAEALSLNYARVASVQPEYGYGPAAGGGEPRPADRDGLWRVDLRSGSAALLVSIDELARRDARPEMRAARHAVNHAVYSPRGTRIVFLHRWLGPRGLFSRLYAARADGSELRLLLDARMVSHYAWRDEDRLLAYARTPDAGDRYHLVDAASGDREAFAAGRLDRFGDGHPSFSADGQWIVTDSYPDRGRMQHLLLCRVADGEVIEAGAFFSPWRYDAARRCDLHPRWDAGGRRISIDSAHEGVRATYVVDVAALLGDA